MSERVDATAVKTAEGAPVVALYCRLLEAWNARVAAVYAACFAEDGQVIGFDGSVMEGRAEVEATLRAIFADHATAAYVARVCGVRFLGADAAVLRAVAGLVQPGGADVNPAVNAHQTLVATRGGDEWRIALFQNTPAQFHGRPELAAALTEELRGLLA